MSVRSLDADGLRYARYWEPVLAAPAQRTLERIARPPARFLDLGAGTGALALAAAARWPAASVVALDASAGMLSVARHRGADHGHDPTRFTWLPADAADIPLGTASVDAVASSFMLQLVDDRAAVLAEVLRVLRPGGTFAFVTWLAEELELPADEHFIDALDALEVEDPVDEVAFRCPRPRDYRSLEQAREELVAAGFSEVRVDADELRYRWTPESYLAYKEDFDERELFESLEAATRERLRVELWQRLVRLPASAFELRGPLVAAVARRPSRAVVGDPGTA